MEAIFFFGGMFLVFLSGVGLLYWGASTLFKISKKAKIN